MPSPLVWTKLHVPRARHVVVPRPRLADRLGGSAKPRLTLISGPAGFGKTTLLAAWAGQAGCRVAWVSLEETEQEPASFWTHVVTALDAAAPGVGTGVLPLLRAPHPPMESVLATLLNELGALADGVDLVLDDYHLADGPEIAGEVAFLLEHLPLQVRLVISTRADPALPLARLRARGELVEIRAADLRFTVDEVTAYLNGVFGLHLEPSEIVTLEERTEGWIAALQLAALSLQGREDAAGFIAGFAGDDRYVVDYLVEEVLGRQPDAVRTFLLETSVLDRLSGSLCDAVTGGMDGKAMLESLERSNLFVVSLDDSRQWYRYHHLFADVLRAHLLDERSDEIADLHRRAAEWYGVAGEPVTAVRHALAAGDIGQAADLMERSSIELLRQRQEATVRGWLDDIPHDVVRRRPVLAVGFIGALMSRGDFETVGDRLDDLERLLAGPRADMVVLDESELARVPGATETYRAALALVAGDPADTVAHAHLAIAKAAPGDDLTVSAASALAGLASWGSGDLEAAHHGYSVAVKGLERAGNIADVLGCSITLGDIRVTQGRLGDALRTYEDALRLAAAHDTDGPLRGTADMVVGLSQITFERNDLAATAEHLKRVEALGERLGLPQLPYRWRVARARLREAERDLSGSVALLEEAEQVYVGDYSPNVQPVAAQRARVLVAQGRIAEALVWARAQHLDPDDDLAYIREYEHLTLARILIHQQRTRPAAHRLLERLQTAAEGGGRIGTLIEILTLQALAHHGEHGRHDVPGAVAPLEQALRLAEPEGYVRVFVGEGGPMATLLEALVRRDPSWAYPRGLRAAFDRAPARPVEQGLVDPLSERELDVLRLLATDLGGPEISRRLHVSLNTVRTHTKKIYAKLGVNSRRTAVTRAGELGLL
ncbi:LuxR C-terminal-related transcriptional regulator [Kribbella alba]|uniref:LuxR C-terminal-related transcriptional regulator n=1 Tax=Kribbella alba TaxID=190197 RepID=A0ABN2FI83_9ACTN